MCGIVGYIDPAGHRNRRSEINHMMAALAHRGPDDEGLWLDDTGILALGFRRLAILDLSPTGHQPMLSADNRFVMVFNGEVYNFQALRVALESKGHTFIGGSDTEVMLAAFCEWGIAEAVKQFNGMFAIALWDKHKQVLYLIRDRMGVKPLYYGWNRGIFFFGSELKSLRAHSKFAPEINQFALGQFFRFSYVPAPHSIYANIHKLSPGSILTIDPGKPGIFPKPEIYWSLDGVSNGNAKVKFKENDEEALLELEAILKESVALRMIADVPLGAFLSGGVDSSTIVALMQEQSSRPVKTFTIGFHEELSNEAGQAKAVASHLGTEHTELYLSQQEAMDVIPKLPSMYDEPFADSSQIPTYLVSKLARREVTVSLSGDGGDELFLGYNRYLWAPRIWNAMAWIPRSTRVGISRLLNTISTSQWDLMYGRFASVVPRRMRLSQFNDKVQKVSAILGSKVPESIYEELVSFWRNPSGLLLTDGSEGDIFPGVSAGKDHRSFLEWMNWMDIQTYLPDDILVKLDRASMAVGLEARVPLLDDHRLVEFAARLPSSMKIRNGKTKWLLRRLLYKYVPARLVERPKMGFAVPIDKWLRGPLREWAEDLLDSRGIEREGILDSTQVQAKWREHLGGTRNWQFHLWNVLMFQSWHRTVDKVNV